MTVGSKKETSEGVTILRGGSKMKILYAVTLLYIITNCQVVYGEEEVSPLKARPPKPDEVLIAGTGLNMVLGRYILVRSNNGGRC